MRVKEFYHTLESYNIVGLESFLDHVGSYLNGNTTIPVSKTRHSLTNKPITFTFSDDLLKMALQDKSVLEKPYEVAIKYGFRGYSGGEKNGIFFQRKGDGSLISETNRLIKSSSLDVMKDLDIGLEDTERLRKVKIVHHNPSGERIVGVYNTKNDRMLFLDFASY